MLRSLLKGSALRQLSRALDQTRRGQGTVLQGARLFSAAAQAEDIKPPKDLFSVPGKYATALFVAAAKGKKLDAVGQELLQLEQLIKSSPDFWAFLKDPVTAPEVKQKGLEGFFKAAGVSDITSNFFAVLNENGRLGKVDKVIEAFEELLTAHKGEVKAIVTVPYPLTDEQRKELKESLHGYLKQGQTLMIKETINRGIMGGLTVEIGEKFIDLSISSRIKKIEALLKDTSLD